SHARSAPSVRPDWPWLQLGATERPLDLEARQRGPADSLQRDHCPAVHHQAAPAALPATSPGWAESPYHYTDRSRLKLAAVGREPMCVWMVTQPLQGSLSRSQIRCQRHIVNVTNAHQGGDIRLVRLSSERISEK